MNLAAYHGYGAAPLGLHWHPGQYHATQSVGWALDRCRAMGVGWVTLLDDGGGSTLQTNPALDGSIVAALLERGIIPVVRLFAGANARFDARMVDTVRRLVAAGVRYVLWQNEPEVGATEWPNRPRDWVRVVTRNWADGAYRISDAGAYPGLWATTTWRWTDADGHRVNPLTEYLSEAERRNLIANGPAWWAVHPYAKNHPLDYPEDDVNRYGRQLSHAEYLAALAEVDAGYRARVKPWVWEPWETSETHINALRSRGMKPTATIDTDDVCFRMYRGLLRLAEQAGLAGKLPLIATECGPCVGERDDGRYPRVTPRRQIEMVDAQLAEARAVPEWFGLCFWLAGVSRLGTQTKDSFEDQGWWTDRHNEPFNLAGELPIVPYLIALGHTPAPPPAPEPLPEVTPVPQPVNDAEAYGVSIVTAKAPAGAIVYRVVRVHHLTPQENNGNHHVFADVLDEQGKRIYGAVLDIAWPTGAATATIDKPPNEPGTNCPLTAGQVVRIMVHGAYSDLVEGIHTKHPTEPPVTGWGHNGNDVGHHSFLVVFQRATEPATTPTPEPPPPVPDEFESTQFSGPYGMSGVVIRRKRDGAIADVTLHFELP